jgi:integrase
VFVDRQTGRIVRDQLVDRAVMECVDEDRRRPSSPKPIERMLVRLGDLATERLRPELVPPFRITPHIMRRTYACLHTSRAEEAKDGPDLSVSMQVLQEAMAHKTAETTNQYLTDIPRCPALDRL